MKKLILLGLCLCFLLLLFPMPVKAAFVTETFTVSHYSYVDHDPAHGEWGKTGSTPWIDETDYPTNFINEGTLSDDTGDYHFENLPYTAHGTTINITQVVFYMNGSNLGAGGSNGTFNFHFWNGTYDDSTIRDHKFSFHTGDGWEIRSEDITYIWSDGLLTKENFNALYFWLVAGTPWISNPVLTLDHVYLSVTYEYSPRWGAFPIRLTLGLIGLIIMVATPTYTIKEVYKNKNYEFLGAALVLFAIGYAFVVCWLIP